MRANNGGVVALFAALMAFACPAPAGVFTFDNFDDGTTQLSSAGPLATELDTGLTGVVGGERYSYVDRTSTEGVVALGINVFPFLGFSFYTSSANAMGIGGLSYGRFTPLNVDFSNPVYSRGILLQDFAADEPGESGTIRMTLHTAGGTNSLAYNIGAFENNPLWLFEDFTGVDLANVLRVDFDWYNFSELGADIEFSMIGISNTIPEPGSALLFLLGGVFLRKMRKKSLA